MCISTPFVQMSEGINIFLQIGGTKDLSQWEQVKGNLHKNKKVSKKLVEMALLVGYPFRDKIFFSTLYLEN